MFGHPPVVWHHDMSKSEVPAAHVPANVQLVRPHVPTRWGDMSIVDATMRGLAVFFEQQRQQRWCVILSGSDYPVANAVRVVHDLDGHDVDAHLECELIDERALDKRWYEEQFQRVCPPGKYFLDHGQKYHRYLSVPLNLPWTRPRPGCRRLYDPRLSALLTPFSKRYGCYVGSQWMTLGPRAAQRALSEYRTRRRLVRHFERTGFGDEAYLHTVLANAPDVRIHQNNWRYTDWSGRAAHPKTLGVDDLPAVFASGAHFARKVEPDRVPSLTDEIDAAVDNDTPLAQA